MSDLDRLLPTYDVVTVHARVVAAPRGAVWDALTGPTLGRAWTVRALLALRGLRASRLADLERVGFLRLAERPGEELVLGLVGRFWRPAGDLVALDADGFTVFDEPGYAKATWAFTLSQAGPATTRLSTETRVQLLGPQARRAFAPYWRVVGPFSGLIRSRILAGLARAAERPR